MPAENLEQVVALAKRRGFIFQSSSIYGGAAAAYDYGPLGIELKWKLEEAWWQEMVRKRQDIVGMDSAILMHPRVWEASGHLESFVDWLAECKKCHKRWKIENGKQSKNARCPYCGERELMPPRRFQLMFQTHLGPTVTRGTAVFLRPETAQGMYVNFDLVRESMRLKLPFGIAQIGKAFRNEITPGNFIFRTVEFTQMEMQFFVKPAAAKKWYRYWLKERKKWYRQVLGLPPARLSVHRHKREELAHYARAACDIRYRFPFGWGEIEGVHNRGDWDLSRHAQFSGRDLRVREEGEKEKFIPWVVETSAGLDRIILALLCEGYREEKVRGERRVVLRLPPALAPITVAVLPLVRNKPALVKAAQEVYRRLLKDGWSATLDEVGSIGRRYRRQDEIGTPWAVTIDYQTLEDNTVTLRERDSMRQIRLSAEEVSAELRRRLQAAA
jgi:glycyl-tRNA synthetase